MATNDELTTLICLFHHKEQANAALQDLLKAGVPESSIQVMDEADAQGASSAHLGSIGIPDRDLQHLKDGLNSGGTLISVSAIRDHVDTVEDIFEDHKASKIDETVTDDRVAPLAAGAPLAAVAASGATAIPIIEEELVVGKRQVDAGGVRVYRRIVEIPVEESVNLREEHVTVDRIPVNRPVTDRDLAQGSQVIELTETAEEAVVGKSARVVEEVMIGKNATERTETIHDTVRSTEVDIEQIAPETTLDTKRTDY